MLILTKFQMLHHSKQNLMASSVVLIKVTKESPKVQEPFYSPVVKIIIFKIRKDITVQVKKH